MAGRLAFYTLLPQPGRYGVMAFNDYLSYDAGKLLYKLGEVMQDIASLIEEIAYVKTSEMQAKAQAYQNSMENTVSGREREAVHNAIALSTSVVDLEARLKAKEEEKWWIVRIFEFGDPPNA
jgi:hypothetical protein